MTARCYLGLCCVLLAAGCTLERVDDRQTPSASPSVADVPRYGVKHLRLVSVTERPGQDRPDTTIFMLDDHGAVERSEYIAHIAIRNMPPLRKHTIVLRRGRVVYNLDVDRKTMRRSTVPSGGSGERLMHVSGLSAADLAAMHVRRRGVDTLLGVPCDVMVIDDADNEVYGTYYLWNDVPVRIEMQVKGMRLVTRPLLIDTAGALDTTLFAVPSGFTLIPES